MKEPIVGGHRCIVIGSDLFKAASALLRTSAAIALTAAACANATEADSATQIAQTIVVTARWRVEEAQAVPQAFSVIDGATLMRSYSNNAQALTVLVPSLNYSSANPRNTSFTIRGLGSSVTAVAQSNDGLEPGVGFYVDQVYQARPAAAAFDFTDVERIEVLRGPQGTLYGKNTTAGAIHVITRAPSFAPEANGELSVGNRGFLQARAMASGPLSDTVAVRIAGLMTRRGGVIRNVLTDRYQNDLHAGALRASVLWRPTETFRLRLTGDWQNFNAECCTQVFYAVSSTLRPSSRQYPTMAAALDYVPPSTNVYDRLTDIDAAVAADTNQGGVSAVTDVDLGSATLTSVSAWRFWNWNAANDRDYTRLSIQTIQRIPSRQDQFSQELRLASSEAVDSAHPGLGWVVGAHFFHQKLKGEPTTVYGGHASFWLLGPAPQSPSDLLDGYGSFGRTRFVSTSYAGFGEAVWRPVFAPRLALTGGLRHTWERKSGRFASAVSGGATPADAAQASAKLSILRPQSYSATVEEASLSGRVNIAYDLAEGVVGYASWSHGSKSGGINMSGLPLDAANNPALTTAAIRPERNTTWEAGLKGQTADRRLTANLALFSTVVRDFQANVVDTGPGALRGYLANIPRVTVQGAELDVVLAPIDTLSLRVGIARADGRYAAYPSGPCPLELVTSGTTACDLTGRLLTNLPKWTLTAGIDAVQPIGDGQIILRIDSATRSSASGDGPASAALMLPGYTLINTSIAYARGSWEIGLFARNLTDANYLQNVTAQAGNSGLVLGTPSEPRLFGVTLRWRL